ncbi:hypothetical protein PIB30_059022 [Stylosanthes scabra]|uniref:GRF-type domain-containing protein n=1 Tax=Stylosanthes scabra TaxID=79078 RepID=A0ABU6RKC2_9FABA|nr:hypothetical protein [Stylosanthes scabra]
MASSQASHGSTSSYRSKGRRTTVLCNYEQIPVLRSSKTIGNPGRRFWGCANYDIGKGCNFFAWADVELQSHEDEVSIMKLKISTLKPKIAYVKIQLLLAATVGIFGWIIAFFSFL